MFVTKVDKNTIQVRFFETDNGDPDGQLIWESNGIFTASDVHHQYGIVMKTPPYRNQQIGKKSQKLVTQFCLLSKNYLF